MEPKQLNKKHNIWYIQNIDFKLNYNLTTKGDNIMQNYLLHTEAPVPVVMAPVSASSEAKLRPHHRLLSLTIPAIALAALVPPIIWG